MTPHTVARRLKNLFRSALYTAAVSLGLFVAAHAVVLFSSREGDLNFPGFSPTSLGTYSKVVGQAGFSYTFDRSQTIMMFRPTATLAYGYIIMAATPYDGAEACIFSTQAVTTLYLSANTGQTIQDAITALSASTRYCYKYSLANTTWDRSQ